MEVIILMIEDSYNISNYLAFIPVRRKKIEMQKFCFRYPKIDNKL
jgi:hypothetical protein